MADEDAARVHDEAKDSMDKAVRKLRAELQKIRTGRASTALLDGLHELERDLHQHIHKENNILFPKALALEAALPH